MAKLVDEIKTRAALMLKHNENLHRKQREYQAMGRVEYQLPASLREFDWALPMTDASPYNAMRGVKRSLANLAMDVNFHPISVLSALEGDYNDESEAARLKANEWETAIKWTLGRTAKRRAAFYDSVIDSGTLYHEIVGQLVHIPTQIKARGGLGDARERAALRIGDWTIKQLHPTNANIVYSEYMPERALIISEKSAQEIVDFWGDAAKYVQARIDKEPEHAAVRYKECDYVDYENRYVWVVEARSQIDAKSGGLTILKPEPWLTIKTGEDKGKPVPFLNIIAVATGSDIDALPEYQRQPLFFPIVQTNMWANANIAGCIEMSGAIATAHQPEHIITSDRGEDAPDIDHASPGGRLVLSSVEKYQQIVKAGLDPAIMEIKDRMTQAIKDATVSDVLVTGNARQDTFAGYNLAVQIAIASLGDIKHLAERYYETAIETMLLLAHYTGEEISGYGKNQKKYVIDSEHIDPSSIVVNVELKPDVPIDRQQRVTTALQMADKIPMDPIDILGFLGVSDPEGTMRGYKLWQMDQADMAGRLQRITAESTGELEQLRQAVGMMEQQLEQMSQQVPEGRPSGVEGDLFNPNEEARGLPPAMADPLANTFEGATGTDRAGNPIGGV